MLTLLLLILLLLILLLTSAASDCMSCSFLSSGYQGEGVLGVVPRIGMSVFATRQHTMSRRCLFKLEGIRPRGESTTEVIVTWA